MYSTTCLICKERGLMAVYIGESARSSYERGCEHQADASFTKSRSHMRDHVQLEHPEMEGGPGKVFVMGVIKNIPAPLTRQVTEAIEMHMPRGQS